MAIFTSVPVTCTHEIVLHGLYSLLHPLTSDLSIESALMEHFDNLIRFIRDRSSEAWVVRCSGASERGQCDRVQSVDLDEVKAQDVRQLDGVQVCGHISTLENHGIQIITLSYDIPSFRTNVGHVFVHFVIPT